MDAVDAIGAALIKLRLLDQNPVPSPLLCDANDIWIHGEAMNRAIRDVSLFCWPIKDFILLWNETNNLKKLKIKLSDSKLTFQL